MCRQSPRHIITLNCDNVLIEILPKGFSSADESMKDLSGYAGDLGLISLEKDINERLNQSYTENSVSLYYSSSK